MELKKETSTISQGGNPTSDPSMIYGNVNPNQTMYNGQPQPQSPYGAQPQTPYGAQPQSPYGAQPQTPYGAQPQSPYGAQPQQPYNNVNTLPNTNYGNVVIKEKSGFPAWAIVLIVLVVLGAVGYLAFGKVFNIFKKADYTPGMTHEKSYSNEFFGVKVDLGSDWKVNQDVYDPEAVKKTLDSKQAVVEFSAQNDLTIEAIGVTVAQTPYNITAAGTDMDRLMEQMKEQYVEEMETSGYNISNIERETMTIAGKTCEGFKMTGKVNGVSMDLSLVQFYMFKDNYVCAFSAASTSEGKCKLVISNNVKGLGE